MKYSFRKNDGVSRAALAVTLCGVSVVCLGSAVLAGWYLHIIELITIRPEFAAMQYMTAGCFVLCGLALIGHVAGWPRLFTLLAGGIPGLVGGLLVFEYATGTKVGFDLLLSYLPVCPGLERLRPSPPTSVCFLLCGSTLAILDSRLSQGFRRAVVWIFASVSLSLSFMAVCGYLTGLSGTYVWGPFIGMAIHTATGMGVLSCGLLLTRWMNRESVMNDPWLPVPVGIAAIVATLVLWQALLADQHSARKTGIEIFAGNLRKDALFRLDAPLRALGRMQRRWEQRGDAPAEEWKVDASAYVYDEKIIAAIAWMDSSWTLRWSAPENEDFPLTKLEAGENALWDVGAALARAQKDHARVLSPIVTLKQGGKGFFAYLPLFHGKEFNGFLIGVVHIRDFLKTVFEETEFANLEVSVFEGKELVYGSGATGPDSAGVTVDFHGHSWRIVVAPTAAFFAENGNKLSDIILILGILLTVAMMVSVRSWQQTGKHARATELANQTLQNEIRERQRIETKLRESEELLRNVLDSATGVSVIATDQNGIITYFSKGSETLLGYSVEETVGKVTPVPIHDPEEVERRGQALTLQLGRTIEGFDVFVTMPQINGSERREWSYLCKDGTRKAVELMVTVLYEASGALRGYLGTAVDITERKRMERELQGMVRAMENARALLEAAGRMARLGHWEIPLDGSGVKWSEVTCSIHEIPPETPVSFAQAVEFFHPDDRKIFQSHLSRTAETGEIFDFEARVITAGKREIWVHSRGEPVRDESGRIIAVRGVFQDVDGQHKAAALLAERNRQLEEANKKILSYAKAKAEFLANMSHEIRTPLNAIIGMSELLHETITENRQLEFVNTIHSSGDVLLSLINDILDFSKIESGQMELERIPVDLHDCVESAFDIVGSFAAKKQLDLLYWIDPAVPAFVLGDVTRLRQVLVNLISNAVKFTGQGEVFVRINRSGGDGKDRKLKVSVRDTGIGIPADKQSKLFQAFSQVDSSTTRRYGGTGLGLAICQRLVGLMNGRIWVESEFGKGAEFLFEIPLEPAEITPPTIYLRGANHDLEGLRILLVDDNETNRWILQSQTSAWGMKARETGYPSEALKWAAQGDPFDFAILDGHMPGMDGYELAVKLREHEHLRHIPIVILTSMADGRKNSADSGIAALLTKPVKTAALFEVIGRLVFGRSGHRTGAPAEMNLAAGCPLKILVAEDNPVNQRVVSLQLERLGYAPEIVSNGLEAVAALRAGKFDVILMDVHMPEMDGFAAAREICHLYQRSERPWIIALTANAGTEDQEECRISGMDDFLSKPVRSRELAEALRKAFQTIRTG